MVTPRVAIFIDGSNLYHSLEENCGRADLDFGALARKLLRERTLFRIYYYNILQDTEKRGPAYQDQQKFLTSLHNVPYLEVRLGTSKYRGEVLVEKGVDIMLATDMLQFAWKDLYDVAILVTGDGDFTYAVQVLKNSGKHAEVAAFPANLASDLGQVADDRHALDKDWFTELWVNQKAASAGTDSRRRRFRNRRGGGVGGTRAQPRGGQSSAQPPEDAHS